MTEAVWQQLGISLGLGLLVGLQREWAGQKGAGIRTFPLITLLGTLSVWLADVYGGWVLAAGLLGVGAVMIAMHVSTPSESHPGPTTEIAALLMFAVGALVGLDFTAPAVAVGGGVAVLLHWKGPLHRFVGRIGEADIRAVFRLVLIALVVLPVMPNRAYGPYDVLNPFEIWLMVVLIVGISLGGYVASRLLGSKIGSVLGGILGGIISSTATTVGYARRTRESPTLSGLAAMVILIASTIVFVRVSVEVAITAPDILPHVLPQFAIMTGFMALISAGAYFFARGKEAEIPEAEDPSEWKTAVVFGVLYALVLFAVAAAKEHSGDRGLYVVAALSGLTDMDAITLSTARMMEAGRVDHDTGWRMMLVGAMFNNLFKVGAVAVLGHRRLLRLVAVLFGMSIAGGAALLWLW